MSKNEFARLLFLFDTSLPDNRVSTVKLLLRNAREFCDRNLDTGEFEQKNEDYNWQNGLYLGKKFTGLQHYLILLEIIGSVFNNVENPVSEKGIKRTLSLFSNKIQDNLFEEVVGLRHSLVHRFSLSTQSKPNGNSFCYSLIWEKETFIVKKALQPWNGIFSSKIESNLTEVCVYNLVEHIEEMYANLISELEANKLDIEPDISELKARYTIR